MEMRGGPSQSLNIMGESNSVTKRKFDFSIEAILAKRCPKRHKKTDAIDVKKEISPLTISPSISPSSPPTVTSTSSFPQWTQCQRDVKKSRRPYSRPTVTALSWWFHHLPFLTVEEMEVVGGLTSLTRHQVKVWWQNRRHSQRGRSEQADPYLHHILHLPLWPHNGHLPEPGSGYRQAVFTQILEFFISRVSSIIIPSSTMALY